MKTMKLDDIRKLPEPTAEEVDEILKFKNTDFSDCPIQNDKELKKFRPCKETHPEWYKPKKTAIQIRLDTDVLEWFKSQGTGYQTKINAILRDYAFS